MVTPRECDLIFDSARGGALKALEQHDRRLRRLKKAAKKAKGKKRETVPVVDDTPMIVKGTKVKKAHACRPCAPARQHASPHAPAGRGDAIGTHDREVLRPLFDQVEENRHPMSKDKGKKPKKQADQLTDAEQATIAGNGWSFDSRTGDVRDEFGNLVAPAAVGAVLTEDARNKGEIQRHDSVKSAPDALDTFVRPGTAIDSDGLMGSPAELLKPRPGVDHVTTPTVATAGPPNAAPGDFSAVGLDDTPQAQAMQGQAAARQAGETGPPPGTFGATMDAARAQGEALLATVQPPGVPAFKADHRHIGSGQYTTGPTMPEGTPAGPSHEVTQVDLSDGASASAFIRSPVAPTPSGVPMVRVIPPEDAKGATL